MGKYDELLFWTFGSAALFKSPYLVAGDEAFSCYHYFECSRE